MMFKFMDGMASTPTWRIIDGVRDVSWTEAWLAVVRDTEDYDPESIERVEDETRPRLPDSVDVHMKHPDRLGKDELQALLPAEPHWERNAVHLLQDGKARAVPILLVHLKYPSGDVRALAVHYGYVLNDEGKTIEKLHTIEHAA